MSLLQDQIETIKARYITDTGIITKSNFLKLFSSLRPYYDLDDEAIINVFEMTDEKKEGAIKASELQRILDTILSIEEPDVVEEEGLPETHRVSICLQQNGRSSVSQRRASLQTYFGRRNTMNSKLLARFDPNKVYEVKHIFEICCSGKGQVHFQQIKNFVKDYKPISCTAEEIIETFSLLKNENQEIITREAFLMKINELEKAILNSLLNSETKIQALNDNNKDRGQTIDHNAPALSEAESNSSEGSEPCPEFDQHAYYLKYSNEPFNEGLDQEVKLILEKVEMAIDRLKKKANDKDVVAVLEEVPFMFTHLQKKLYYNEKIFKEHNDKLGEHIKRESLLRGKIEGLEKDNDSQSKFFEELRSQNDALYEANQEFELKLQLHEHIEKELTDKNNETVSLERKIRQLGLQNEELKNQILSLQNKQETESKNTNELLTIIKQLEKEKDENVEINESRPLDWPKIALEIETLKLELFDANESFQREKDYFKKVLAELETQLENTKNYADGVCLEKVKLEQELKVLQERSLRESVLSKKGSRRGTVGLLRKHFGEEDDISRRGTIGFVPKQFGNEDDISRRDSYDNDNGNMGSSVGAKEIDFTGLIEEKFVYQAPKNDKMFDIFEDQGEEDEKSLPRVSKAPEFDLNSYGENKISLNKNLKEKDRPRLAHDFSNLTKDYLEIRYHPRVVKLLKENEEESTSAICFSDYIYRINSKEERQHRALFITSDALYCLHPRKNYEVKKRIPLSNIQQVTVITSSAGLCILHVKDSPDYLIESYKRLNLILYLQGIFKMNDFNQFPISYQEKLLKKLANTIVERNMEQYKSFMNPELQSAYKNAAKFGELYMKSGGIFNTLKKYFFLLTDVGLICFKAPGSQKPIDFIPVIDYLVIDLENKGDRKYAFEIKFPFSEFEVQLSAESELEKKEWMRAIKKLQKDQLCI